jgi:hypothetical protein
MASTDQQQQQHDFVQAFRAQQERIERLEAQLVHVEERERSRLSAVTVVTSALKPPKPETFDGRHVDTFLFALDKMFKFVNVPEHQKVDLCVTYFRGSALRWYKYIEHQHASGNDTVLQNWSEFKKLLRQHFQAANTETVVRNKLNALHQLGSVSKYNDMFNELIIEVLDIDERTKIDMYCRGLKPNVQLHVSLRTPSTLEQAQEVAMNVDNILNEMNIRRQRFPANNRAHPHQYGSEARPMNGSSVPMEMGNIEHDHNKSGDEFGQSESLNAITNNRNRKFASGRNIDRQELQKLKQEGKCFRCQKTGHLARNCQEKL